METRTRFIFLMSPKEFKQEKAGTGRLTHLCLPNSKLYMGENFDVNEDVQALIHDPQNYPVLLYPGIAARNLSKGDLTMEDLGGRRLVVFLIDATWGGARKLLRLSPSLQRLPRIMFTTLEAVHELLTVLERSGLDRYPLPEQLHSVFQRMQDFQLKCAADLTRPGYRRRAYRSPEERAAQQALKVKRRRMKFLKVEPVHSSPEQPNG